MRRLWQTRTGDTAAPTASPYARPESCSAEGVSRPTTVPRCETVCLSNTLTHESPCTRPHAKSIDAQPQNLKHDGGQDCVRRDAEAVHARGECQALVGLAKMGVEGDSQPMRLALRIATLNNDQPRQRRDHDDDAAANPFHTPAFVAGLDHHFDATPAAVRQGVLAVAQALGACVQNAVCNVERSRMLSCCSVRPTTHGQHVQPASSARRVLGRLPLRWRASCWPSSATRTGSETETATCSGSGEKA